MSTRAYSTPAKPSASSASPSPAAPRGGAHDGTTHDTESDYKEDASSSYLYEEDREDEEGEEGEEEYEEYEEEEAQEALLTFSEFALDPAMAREHHRLVSFHAFEHFIAVGTNQGFVLLFDHQPQSQESEGGEAAAAPLSSSATTSSSSPEAPSTYAGLRRALHHHTEPVQDISCSADERYLASMDRSGTIAIQSLADESDVWVRRTDTPLSSIALHPLYGHHDERPFLCASGEKILLWTRSSLMLGHRRSVVLSDHHGKVHSVRWCHTAYDLVAWLAERGVCVYDVEARQLLRFIPRPTQGTIRSPSLYPATLVWDTLGMASTVGPSPSSSSLTSTMPREGVRVANVLCWGWADWVESAGITLLPTTTSTATATTSHTARPTATSTSSVSMIGRWQVERWPGLVTASAGPAVPVASNAAGRSAAAAVASVAARPLAPDDHLYPNAGTGPSPSPPHASQVMGTDARDDGDDDALAVRVCGLLPFGSTCYLLLVAMVDPSAEATIVDLEVRIVARHDLAPLYRGRLLVPLVHPLQLSLRGVGGPSRAHETRKATASTASPYTSARASSLSSTTNLARAGSAGTAPGLTTVPPSRTDSGLLSSGRAPSTPSPASSPAPTVVVPGLGSPTNSNIAVGGSTARGERVLCHRTGLTEAERQQSLAALYADPSRTAQFPPDAAAYWIVSLNTVVRALPAQVEDHVTFLLAQGAVREAYQYAKPRAHLLPNHDLHAIGAQLLVVMLEEVDEGVRRAERPPSSSTDSLGADDEDAIDHVTTTMDDVVSLLPEILQDDCAEWERWIYILDQRGDSWRVSPFMPVPATAGSSPLKLTAEDVQPLPCRPSTAATTTTVDETDAASPPRIGAQYYDLVLLRCLEHDPVLFNDTLHRCEGLYHPDVVLKPLETRYRSAMAKARTSTARASVGRVATEYDTAVQNRPALSHATSSSNLVGASSSSVADTTDSAPLPPPTTLSFDEARLYALGEAYGRVLRVVGRDEEALEVLLRVERSRELFTFIRARSLYAKALDILPGLFARSTERTVKLLLEHATPPPSAPSASAGSAGDGAGDGADDGASRAQSLDMVVPASAAGMGGRVESLLVMPSPAVLSHRSGGATGRLGGFASAHGGAADPLRPEQVVQRLQGSDRHCLWQYLVALRQAHPDIFSGVARRHAQLVATLYMDYSPEDLLAFLKGMSMYLDKMKEIYALCKKNQLIEEMLFIMARLGKEEEGVRVIIEQQKNVRKAVDFVLSIPSKNEQRTLFRRLVEMAVATQQTLPLFSASATEAKDKSEDAADRDGTEDSHEHRLAAVASPTMPNTPPFAPKRVSAEQMRYTRCVHYTPPHGDTVAKISARFDVPVEAILQANHMPAATGLAESAAAHQPAPSPCIVPVNLLASLLITVADPAYADNPAVDLRYVLECLPDGEPLPGAGACLAALLHARCATVDFQSTVLRVTETDLSSYYGQLLKRRTAAVRMGPSALCCAHCGQREAASFLPRGSGTARLAACREALQRRRGLPTLAGRQQASEPTSPWLSSHHSGSARGDGVYGATAASGSGAIVFPCRHAYHPACLLQSLVADGCLREDCNTSTMDVRDFLAHPDVYAAPRLNRVLPYCRLCMQTAGVPTE